MGGDDLVEFVGEQRIRHLKYSGMNCDQGYVTPVTIVWAVRVSCRVLQPRSCESRAYVFVLTICVRDWNQTYSPSLWRSAPCRTPTLRQGIGGKCRCRGLTGGGALRYLVAGCPRCAWRREGDGGGAYAAVPPPRQHILPAFQLSITAPYAESLSIRSTPLSGKF